MLPEGRWVAAALLVTCLHVSCSEASNSAAEVEGAKWKPDPPARTLKHPQHQTRETADKWEEVTNVLEKAKLNSTFPGSLIPA